MARHLPFFRNLLPLAFVSCSIALSQTAPSSTLKLDTGKEIFDQACAACHGHDGRGANRNLVGFDTRLPDFTDCKFATKEPAVDWSATIHNGGPARGFSTIMPSFRDILTEEQIEKAIEYLQGFCAEKKWPRGDLNLPRATVTEKAFPENETVITTAINAHGAPAVTNQVIYEKRTSAAGQLELLVPYNFTHDSRWASAFGDITFGYKHMVAHSMRTGSILSLAGEMTVPTGDVSKGTGGGATILESFAAYGQILPKNMFYQLQTGIEVPTDQTKANKAFYAREALGVSLSGGHGLGKSWSPMIEWIADREFATGATTNWDLVPQLQIPLSRRQHIMANVGVRVPVNNRVDRPPQIVFYVFWDWFDGGLTKGW